MKVALFAFGLLACTGCVRAAEGVVREQAASAFACADYALRVEEVGPDVYRASGCGQELIYACREREPKREAAHRGTAHREGAAHEAAAHEAASRVAASEDPDAFGNEGVTSPIVCARRP